MNTEHLIFVVNGNGLRKKDYYEDASISPNTRRVADEGFVFPGGEHLLGPRFQQGRGSKNCDQSSWHGSDPGKTS